ncbi:SRPBCC domain-containing protein [uncultured Muriicola sp.]|uniref:SRPBCC domain-containing protein n=1 Tax=uncultured Muriicola sp. TaxID=1583102 RepID=UPI0026051A13|nr:SRPBCC domain-containing protein [uncultured Muriicola sp.]
MKKSFKLEATFPVSSEELYNAWLDGGQHSKMTGGEATANMEEGDEFTAWDGYIWGVNKKLKPHSKIVQSWRTSEFKETDEDSQLTIYFKEIPGGCELTLVHSNIPEGQPNYELGWHEHYFIPMQEYFKLSNDI